MTILQTASLEHINHTTSTSKLPKEMLQETCKKSCIKILMHLLPEDDGASQINGLQQLHLQICLHISI